MSDYVHEKVVRILFPKEILNICNTEDVFDCEVYLKNLLGELWNEGLYSFKLGYSENEYYIDWLYYDSYGVESSEFGWVRYLNEKELEVIKPYFDKLNITYKDKDLRVVNYCYYNCSEPLDYYEIIDEDDSKEFLNFN